MPFRKNARITLENRSEVARIIYYQVNYALMDVPEDAAYFHAQFRASTPLKQGEDHVILDGARGRGHYVGTAMHVGLNGTGNWWGAGRSEVLHGRRRASDHLRHRHGRYYFLGAYDWDVGGAYMPYNSLYGGMYYLAQAESL